MLIKTEEGTYLEAIKIEWIDKFDPGSRLFYELGKYLCWDDELGWLDWTGLGVFKEIENPIGFISTDVRTLIKGYLDHHNFMEVAR